MQDVDINNGKQIRSAPPPFHGARSPLQKRLAALQLVLLSLPRVPLLSGVSPCPELEAPSGVSPCPKLEAPSGVSPCPKLEAPSGVSPCPELEAPCGVSPCPEFRVTGVSPAAPPLLAPGLRVASLLAPGSESLVSLPPGRRSRLTTCSGPPRWAGVASPQAGGVA